MPHLNEWQQAVLVKILQSSALQELIGSGEWDLDDAEEYILWEIIEKLGE